MYVYIYIIYLHIYTYIYIYIYWSHLDSPLQTKFFAYFRPFYNASRAMLKNDSSEICWSKIWDHQNPATNLKTYKPTDLNTYKPTSIKIQKPYGGRWRRRRCRRRPPFGGYMGLMQVCTCLGLQACRISSCLQDFDDSILCSNIFRTSHFSTWLWMHCQMV